MAVIESAEIQLRATATGVKQGLAVAQAEFKKLNERKKELEEDLKLKINAPELVKLREDLKALQEKKKELETGIRFPVESDNVKNLNSLLQEAERQIAEVREKLSKYENFEISMSFPEYEAIKERLDGLENVKKELTEELIPIAVKADTDAAKNALEGVKKQMSDVERKIAIETDAQGIEKAKTELKELSGEMRNAQAEAKTVEGHFPAIAAAATAAFLVVTKAVKSGVEAFNEYTVRMNGLQSQMEYLGESSGKAAAMVVGKTKDGLLSDEDVATTIRLLTEYGMSLEQAGVMIDRLKDRAAYGRRENTAYGDSIKQTAQGILSGSSQMAKAAGVYKTISDMHKEYAASIGKSADELTRAEEVQAVYNGVLEQTQRNVGDAAKYAQTLAGSQAELANETTRLAASFGESIAPAVQTVTQSMAEGVKIAREFVGEHQELVRSATTLGVVWLGLIATTNGLKAGKLGLMTAAKLLAASEKEAAAATASFGAALNAVALNPLIIGITAVVSMYVMLAQETKAWEEKQKKLNDSLENYNKLMEVPATAENAQAYRDNVAAAQEYQRELDNLIEKHGELARAVQNTGIMLQDARERGFVDKSDTTKWITEHEEALRSLGIVIKDAQGRLKDYKLIQEELAKAEGENTAKVRESNDAMREKEALTKRAAIDTQKLVLDLKELDDTYIKVSKGEKLSADELLKLVETNREFASFVAKTTEWQDKLAGKLEELAEAKRRTTISMLEQEREATKTAIENTNARITSIRTEIAAMKGLAGALALTAVGAFEKLETDRLQHKLDEINASIKLAETDLGTSSGGGGKSKTADELAMERYQADKKAYDMQKSLREQSLDEQIEALEKLRAKYAQYTSVVQDADSQLYALRRQKNDEWYQSEMATLEKLSRGMEERTDVEGVLQKLQELKEAAAKVYEDYPERWKTIENELDDAIIAREEDRANKIMRINSNAVDELIAAQERRVSVERQMSGLVIEGVEYKFDSRQQAEAYEQCLKYLDDYIAELQSREQSLTDDEYRELQNKIKWRQQYYEKIEDLHISALKEQQEAEKKAAEKELKDKTEAAKKVNQAYIASVKERYSEVIRLAEEAANAEIAIYEKRIKEIDALLKSEAREDTDSTQLDRIRRLQEQLAYEIDPNNRYELEKKISQEQEDYDKRKRKETLEDERDRLKEQVNAVRDSLAERKKELQDYRDEEIRLAEESYTSYIDNLKAQSEALSAKEKADTEVVKEEIATRTTENKNFLEKKKEQLEVSGREERRVMNQTTSNIISDLYSRLWEFAEAGRRAGQAYAAAFQSEVSSLASSFSASSLSMSSYSGASAYSSSDNDVLYLPEPADITVNQNLNFYTPTATPSQVADAAKTGAEQLLRYS